MKTLIGQVQQVHAPGGFVSLVLDGQQIAVSCPGIHTDKYRLRCLEYLVRNANTDIGKVLCVIDLLSLLHGLADNVMDRAQTQVVIVEHVFEDFYHAPEAAVANQDQGQNELANPVFRHRKVKENLLVVSRGHKDIIERI